MVFGVEMGRDVGRTELITIGFVDLATFASVIQPGPI